MPCYSHGNAFCAAMLSQISATNPAVPIPLSKEQLRGFRDKIRGDRIDRMGGLEHFGIEAIIYAENLFDRFYQGWALILTANGSKFVQIKKIDGELCVQPSGEPLRMGDIIAYKLEPT